MWAQTWGRVDDFTRPYPTIDEVNPTTAMINQVTSNSNECIIICITL